MTLAVRLLEDAVAGRVTESTWLHVEYDAAGRPTLDQRDAPPPLACPLCTLSASGDAGLAEFPLWLAELEQSAHVQSAP